VFAPSRFDGRWMLLSEDPEIGQRRWIMADPDVPNKWHVRTETWATSLIAEDNERERNASAGQRFGNRRKVASIPMNVLYGKELLEAHRADDQPYIRKFLNKPENRWMRTFEGTI
jgi:hypothetical protein